MKAIVLSIFAFSLCLTVHLEARTWTSLDGKTIEAEFVKADKANVTLKRSDGKTFTLAVNKLSESDQKFVADKSEKAATAEKIDTPKITGKIRDPKDGKKVESGFLFKAITRGAPKGYVAMLFTRNMSKGAIHPRGRILEANRSINTNVHHGPTDFGEWSLHLYVLPEADADGLMAWLLIAEQMAATGQLKQ
ncbi:MAG: hypothetical protein IID32_08960, partial [Planctomycetes bacterium]|nr:hypothetical protein [Planctomycetota bacterium]